MAEMIKTDEKDNMDCQVIEELNDSPKVAPLPIEELAKLTDGRDMTFISGLPESIRHYSVDELNKLENGLRWKVDVRMLPILVIMFMLNILDRNNIASARLQGLEEDLRLNGTEYNTALMILYVGYTILQIPSNMALPHIKPSYVLPGCMLLWGIISASTAATDSFIGILMCRFFVGFAEAPFFAGSVFLMSGWYKKSEIAARITFLYCGNTLANAFGGLIAAGVLDGMNGTGGLHAWRWLFILEGSATILVAACGIFLLPNWPRNTKWLSTEEKDLAVYRLSWEAAGAADDENDGSMHGLKQAVTDPKVWLLVLMQHCLLVAFSFTYFFPSIVETLGYPDTETLLLTAPPYFFAFFTSIAVAWHSGRVHERCFHIVIPIIVSAVGQIIFISTSKTAPRYFSTFLMTAGVYCAFNIVLAWVSSAIPRPRTKRAVAMALVAALSNASHTYTSYIFPKSDAPRYFMAGSVLTVFCFLCAGCALVLRFWLGRLNSSAEREEAGTSEAEAPITKATGLPRGFRYQL